MDQLRYFLQFKEVHFPDVFLSVAQGDNGILVGNKVRLIRNILCQDAHSEKYALYEEFGDVSNFFTTPLNSSDLRIFVVSGLTGELKTVNRFVAIPLIHTL